MVVATPSTLEPPSDSPFAATRSHRFSVSGQPTPFLRILFLFAAAAASANANASSTAPRHTTPSLGLPHVQPFSSSPIAWRLQHVRTRARARALRSRPRHGEQPAAGPAQARQLITRIARRTAAANSRGPAWGSAARASPTFQPPRGAQQQQQQQQPPHAAQGQGQGFPPLAAQAGSAPQQPQQQQQNGGAPRSRVLQALSGLTVRPLHHTGPLRSSCRGGIMAPLIFARNLWRYPSIIHLPCLQILRRDWGFVSSCSGR